MSPEALYLSTFGMIIVLKIVCFVLGYLTIRLGYQLITSGVKGQFKFSTQFGGLKADLASLSPGLLFVLLGVLLIGFAMYVEKDVSLEKGAVKPQRKVEKPALPIPEGSLVPQTGGLGDTEDDDKRNE